MNIQKPRIGKNAMGWYVAVQTWYGTFHILEGHASWDEAMGTAGAYLATHTPW